MYRFFAKGISVLGDRRRFALIGGRTKYVDNTPCGVTRTHVAFLADSDGMFQSVCKKTAEPEAIAEGVFEELREQATCVMCARSREPMLPPGDWDADGWARRRL
jgi:hypothetical protein